MSACGRFAICGDRARSLRWPRHRSRSARRRFLRTRAGRTADRSTRTGKGTLNVNGNGAEWGSIASGTVKVQDKSHNGHQDWSLTGCDKRFKDESDKTHHGLPGQQHDLLLGEHGRGGSRSAARGERERRGERRASTSRGRAATTSTAGPQDAGRRAGSSSSSETGQSGLRPASAVLYAYGREDPCRRGRAQHRLVRFDVPEERPLSRRDRPRRGRGAARRPRARSPTWSCSI